MLDYNSLDPGIRDVVRELNRLGYDTTDSGDGVSKPEMGCAMPFRHVVVVAPENVAASGLARTCHDIQTAIESFDTGHSWSVEATYTTLGSGWSILAAEYDPAEIAEMGA